MDKEILLPDELETKLNSLSGYRVNIRLASFFKSILIYQANAREIQMWYKKLNEPETAFMLWDVRNRTLLDCANTEMQRLFSNFLMSIFATREHLYAIRNAYYKDTVVIEELKKVTLEKFAENGLASFMHDFRNYVVHRGYPEISQQLTFDEINTSNDIFFNKEELLKYDGWSTNSKRYINDINIRVKLIDLVNNYSDILNAYYNDVRKILIKYHYAELLDLKAFKEKYDLRLEIVNLEDVDLRF